MVVKSLRSALLELAEESVARAERLERGCPRCWRAVTAEAQQLRRTAAQAREVAESLRF